MNTAVSLFSGTGSVEPRMTSLQIAESTGKDHAHIMRDIRNLVEKVNQANFGLVKQESHEAKEEAKAKGKRKAMSENVVDLIFDTFNNESTINGYRIEQSKYTDQKGEERTMYVLNGKAVILLASGYNPLLRMKIIDRWEELEMKDRQQLPAIPQTYSQALMLAAKQAEEIEKQQLALNEQTQIISDMTNTITDMQQRLSYTDQILASKSTMAVTGIAQDYGMSAKAFNIVLRNAGIQHKVNRQWILYAKHLNCGYVQSRTYTFTHKDGTQGTSLITEWTQKGRLFLYNELKKCNVLPVIER